MSNDLFSYYGIALPLIIRKKSDFYCVQLINAENLTSATLWCYKQTQEKPHILNSWCREIKSNQFYKNIRFYFRDNKTALCFKLMGF